MKRLTTSTCIGCGDPYLFTSIYKGNYCSDCHETWSTRQPDRGRPKPRPIRSRVVSSVRRIVDEDDAPSRYDEE
ncbi:hypothetical protein C474_12556 [Halogeometricum pallidum JCM 14848]|uniref:Small CPxCG-related zinc finger protein n=1 Tax=Halogeometricum pallidum JCM 14848 TaxID=1227487 RepID=M0D2W2_HALPD|nr:hypothetical protein [Halogeometricum pallidum]ELZ29866.1 hypothetical protein C474_12556 [Halogeometricum pallidum JCM 14848]